MKEVMPMYGIIIAMWSMAHLATITLATNLYYPNKDLNFS